MMELSLTPDMFLPYQGQPYCGQPAASCSISNVQAPPPPPPLSSLLPAPGHIPTPAPILIPGPVPAPVPAPTPAPLKPGQGGFRKVCRTEEAGPCPFPGLPAGVLEMRVKEGSKIRNLMGFAMTRMQGGAAGDAGGTGLRQVVFTGSGRAVTKTITCAEIMKRKVGGLHQLTKLCYRSVREVWESLEGGAPDMTMHRTVPSISILLSKDQLDPREPGYQPPETLGALWEPPAQGQREGDPPTTNKRPLSPAPYSSQPECKRPCRSDGGLLCTLPKMTFLGEQLTVGGDYSTTTISQRWTGIN